MFPPVSVPRPNRIRTAAAAFLLTAASNCSAPGAPVPGNEATGKQPVADIIFLGNHIIPMDGSSIEAVAVVGDTIAATGARNAVLAMRGEGTRVVELGERALLPGFIDTHSHLPFVGATTLMANLASPPVGTSETVADILEKLSEKITAEQITPGTWVLGYGYDDSLLADQRHPTRQDLDKVSTEHPIVLLHVSGHLMATNSKALEIAGITAETPEPAGGHIQRYASGEPNGVLEETATYPLRQYMLEASPEAFEKQVNAAVQVYAAQGFTTVQDGGSSPAVVGALKGLSAKAVFPIDIVLYPIMTGAIACTQENFYEAQYERGVRVGGVKFMIDGSPQGRTAFLTQPYALPPEGKGADYRAYPAIEAGYYFSKIDECLDNGVPTLSHANGDAAIDMMLDGVESAVAGEEKLPDHRAVIIHAQLIREDQLDRVADLGVVPSFYSAHPFFWGDWHKVIFGPERASRISPLRSAINRGIHFTIHNDAPVIPPMSMRLAEITVTRKTRSGVVLGEEQRVTAYEALYALTMGGAYQYFEEDSKGSITTGKRADLVVLETDPLLIDPDALGEVAIVETIARGKSVYVNPDFE
ncbi:amidohydrolase [Hyphomonas sp. NPDC076900]|uniref:amidohydrolase n=1 Tax=unclassified Hyphomonas TaxID=2630699 RepID=UPI003D0041CD